VEKVTLITPTCRNHAGLRGGKSNVDNWVNSQATVDNSKKGTFWWKKSRWVNGLKLLRTWKKSRE
jgi:hypothetical protein